MSRNKKNALAGIEYSGQPGVSKYCKDAVMRLLQYGDRITHARILSCSNTHCLLLTVNYGDLNAVKSGFGSGYYGEGAHAFSYVLQLLDAHGAEIDEHEVTEDVIERVDTSSLTLADIDRLNAADPIRPMRWHEYMLEKHWETQTERELWKEFPPVIPFAIIDSRISDLAISFWEDPDKKLLTAYRRLEDIVRERTGINDHGARLFSQAFVVPTAKLGWKDSADSEQTGRGNLFTSAYIAYRNRRAHREIDEYSHHQLTEFLLLNHLFLLEKEACEGCGRGASEEPNKGA